jgi:hypothetical protein
LGTTIDCWIEYDEHDEPPFSQEPEVLPLDQWIGLSHVKDYAVYGAIAGMRNEKGIPPLFERRGIPPMPSRPVDDECRGDDDRVGWHYPDEVKAAIAHQNVNMDHVSLEMHCVLHVLEFFTRKLGNNRVRFVFYIE